MKWEQIKTPYFRVIFDSRYEAEAQRTANILETVYEPAARSLNKYPRWNTVVLQNQSTISNGFVTMAPRRAEFNTYPTQQYNFSGNNSWMELLSIHEYRHMVQYEKSLTGFTKVMYYMFGQATAAGFANIAVPDWFWEGDAVVTETALTASGRGRIPYFSRVLRANVAEYGSYSYNKQYLRSYKDYVPDHYVTGYFFSAYLRKKYGEEVFDKVTQTAWSLPFIPFIFSNSLRMHTGKFLVKNYKEFIGEMEEEWEEQRAMLDTKDYPAINKRKNGVYTNYSYPSLLPDGSLLVLKSGLGDIETFVKIRADGHQEKVFVAGFLNASGRISTNGEVLVWNELITDLRWDARVYSDIKLYNLRTGKQERVTRRQRFSSAAVSPDGTKIATVETDLAGKNTLVVLDVSGRELHRVNDPQNGLYIMPDWDLRGEYLVAVKLLDQQKSVVLIDPASATEKILFEAGDENVGYPKLYGDLLFYGSPYNGIDNIYLFDMKSQKHYQVTNAHYGAYHPEYDPERDLLYFNVHDAHGFDVSMIPLDTNQLSLKSRVKISGDDLVETISRQENYENVLEEVTNHEFPVEKYPKLAGIINPHSWGVTYGNTVDEYHFFVASQDVISTTRINAGYTYNLNEEVGRWQVSASYQGLFPVIDFNIFQGDRSVVEEILDTARGYSWEESGAELGLSLPLMFTDNKYSESLTLGGLVSAYRVKNHPLTYPYEPGVPEMREGNLYGLKLNASYRRNLKRSAKDINPRWGQQLRAFLYTTPFGGDYSSNLFAAEGTFFFPGLFKHHSLSLRGSYQWEDKQNYTFRSPVVFPRGYTYSSFDRFYSWSANYALPLLYPDLGLGPILYIARVRTNLFYDHGYGKKNSFYAVLDREKYYHSLGADVLFDFNFMRFLPRLTMGFRVTYLPVTQEYSTGFLIGSLGF